MTGNAREGVCKREGESVVEEKRVWIEEREREKEREGEGEEGGGGCREREREYISICMVW